MGSLSDEEDQFFDTREEITSVSDSGSDCPENSLDCDYSYVDSLRRSVGYEVWTKNPGDVRERRDKFLKWMGFGAEQTVENECCDDDCDRRNVCCSELDVESDRISECSGAVLRSSNDNDEFSSSQSSLSCWSSDARELLDGSLDENFFCRIRNLDNGMEFIVDELEKDGMLGRIRDVGSNQLLTVSEFERRLGLSPLVQRVMRRDAGGDPDLKVVSKRVKMGWLKRLGAAACIVNTQVDGKSNTFNDPRVVARDGNQLVRVRSYKKRLKEFSALYMRQDIPAHEGSILTMRFSPDGHYLASAGEDGVVRVWQVMKSEKSDQFDALDPDPSHAYFTVNNFSELVPLQADKEKKGKFKRLPTTSNSACVIFPRKLFRISDKPIHEFHGHFGEVLDLSWSKERHLLSSSIDKTVRLWQVGCHRCLQVFSHNDYVTCVQFNPVDENYFISGSIDGKVRIWEIPGCQVVDWTDIAEIVTAVCYQPDGKGGIVGSISGNCRFYDVSDNRLQLYAQVCLQGKKKSPFNRITGFQFSPSDPAQLMVTSADSQIRILQGVDVICKYRGIRNNGSHISASFSLDGTRIVSASEDSNVYIWNCDNQDGPVPQMKNNWSCERFFSNNATVAIPWSGMTCENTLFDKPSDSLEQCCEGVLLKSDSEESSKYKLPFSSPDHFSLNLGFFMDSLTKGSATWPEENLPSKSLVVSSAMCKSQYKFLKTSCQSMHCSHHAWGMVIVTAGWDGRIRSFQNYGLPVRV